MSMSKCINTRTHTEIVALNAFNQPFRKPPKSPHFCNPHFILLLQQCNSEYYSKGTGFVFFAKASASPSSALFSDLLTVKTFL